MQRMRPSVATMSCDHFRWARVGIGWERGRTADFVAAMLEFGEGGGLVGVEVGVFGDADHGEDFLEVG